MDSNDVHRVMEMFEQDEEFEELRGVLFASPFERAMTFSGREHNRLFTRGTNRFVYSHFSTGLGFDYDGRSVAAVDINVDGAPDLLIDNRQEQPFQLLYNELPPGGFAVGVVLENRRPNHAGIGARVTVSCGGASQLKQVTAGDGFLTQATTQLHFGLGRCAERPSVHIRWPDGVEETTTIDTNAVSSIRRGEGVVKTVRHKARGFSSSAQVRPDASKK